MVENINQILYLLKADGTPFYDIKIEKFIFSDASLSLDAKLSGSFLYPDLSLLDKFTRQEYVEYQGQRYWLQKTPNIEQKGLLSDNSDLQGMIRFTCEFIPQKAALYNIPFSDIALPNTNESLFRVGSREFYLFSRIDEFVSRIDANLMYHTQESASDPNRWKCIFVDGFDVTQVKLPDEVMSFQGVFISDALKTLYDTYNVTWNVLGKTIYVGTPINEVGHIFKFGQGVGLLNNDRVRKDNMIITRLAYAGSNNNLPFRYPIIKSYIGNNTISHPYYQSRLMPTSYVDAVRLKVDDTHPDYDPNIELTDYIDAIGSDFVTQINPNLPVYHYQTFDDIHPTIKDLINKYGDPIDTFKSVFTPELTSSTSVPGLFAAVGERINSTVSNQQSMLIGSPENGSIKIKASISIINTNTGSSVYTFPFDFDKLVTFTQSNIITIYSDPTQFTVTLPAGTYHLRLFGNYSLNPGGADATVVSDTFIFNYTPQTYDRSVSLNFRNLEIYAILQYYLRSSSVEEIEGENWEMWATLKVGISKNGDTIGTSTTGVGTGWDDYVDPGTGNVRQPTFEVELHPMGFDLWASAAVQDIMTFWMNTGDCQGAKFQVSYNAEEYDKSFFITDENGTIVFDPTYQNRDWTLFPDSTDESIKLSLIKDIESFGINSIMPNQWQQPRVGDKFVIINIELPQIYIDEAQLRLDTAAYQYLIENNFEKFEYPLTFDAHYLAENRTILDQININTIIPFEYKGILKKLPIDTISIRYGDNALPKYDIKLTDEMTVNLNSVGMVADGLARLDNVVSTNEIRGARQAANFLQSLRSAHEGIFDVDGESKIKLVEALLVRANSLLIGTENRNFAPIDARITIGLTSISISASQIIHYNVSRSIEYDVDEARWFMQPFLNNTLNATKDYYVYIQANRLNNSAQWIVLEKIAANQKAYNEDPNIFWFYWGQINVISNTRQSYPEWGMSVFSGGTQWQMITRSPNFVMNETQFIGMMIDWLNAKIYAGDGAEIIAKNISIRTPNQTDLNLYTAINESQEATANIVDSLTQTGIDIQNGLIRLNANNVRIGDNVLVTNEGSIIGNAIDMSTAIVTDLQAIRGTIGDMSINGGSLSMNNQDILMIWQQANMPTLAELSATEMANGIVATVGEKVNVAGSYPIFNSFNFNFNSITYNRTVLLNFTNLRVRLLVENRGASGIYDGNSYTRVSATVGIINTVTNALVHNLSNIEIFHDGDIYSDIYSDPTQFMVTLPAGTYHLRLFGNYGLSPDTTTIGGYASLKISILAGGETVASYVKSVNIEAPNGSAKYYSPDKYSYISWVNNVLTHEIRNGNYGLRVTSNGLQKMINGTTWVAL